MNIGAAEAGLNAYNQAREGGELGELVDTLESDLIDLIADLLHLAERRLENPEAILRLANYHYNEESKETCLVSKITHAEEYWFCPNCLNEWNAAEGETTAQCPKCGARVEEVR